MSPITDSRPGRAPLAKWAAAAAAGAAALVAIGSYGNGSQWATVPFFIGVAVVLSAIEFGLLAPRALRAIATGAPSAGRWALGHGIAAVLLLAAFWTGAEIVVGAAAILLAVTGRRQQTGRNPAYRVTIWLAGAAITLSVAWTAVNAALGN